MVTKNANKPTKQWDKGQFKIDNLSKRHTTEPRIKQYLKDKWITRKQFDHMSAKQLLQVGAFNKENGRHPQPSVVGKTNDDYDKKTTKTNNNNKKNKK